MTTGNETVTLRVRARVAGVYRLPGMVLAAVHVVGVVVWPSPPPSTGHPSVGGPYDLRHAAVSLWLNSGVSATEVARRSGHGVSVLLKVYAHCIDGQADAANKRIIHALGIRDAEPDSSDEGDCGSEQSY